MLVLVAALILAILAAVAVTLTTTRVKRDKEAELLFRGMAIQKAIGDYYHSNRPGTFRTYPRSLEDLLSDPRYPERKHLRALYMDPFGGDWTLLKAPDGGIAGVASSSQEKPMKEDGFPKSLESFVGAQHYSDWIFLYEPSALHPE
jgi:type II secretory pathway pseudopilin PulG